MFLKVNNNKIEIIELKIFSQRFKSLKFVLNKLDYGVLIKNKRIINTYFFCQKVDICLTDKDNIITNLYKDVRSERLIIKLKKRYVYYLPQNTIKDLNIGDKLKIIK